MEAEKKRRQFRALHAALAAAAILGILAFLMFPALFRARVGALRARCLSNLKQVGLALKQYALDNDEAFPWDESEQDRYYRFPGKIHPQYVSGLGIFLCPSSRDRLMLVENRGAPNSPFRESECRSGLSYAYGHKQGKPWTEEAPTATKMVADKYAAQDYTEELFPEGRYANHWRGKIERIEIGRNFVCVDGSASWDQSSAPLEANPEWNVNWDVSPGEEYPSDNGGDPKHDQTGPDWWSDPPDK
jgi:hypothetical protein